MWAEWSACSATCQLNATPPTRQHQRYILQQPIGGGEPCPPLTESGDCNVGTSCPLCNCVGCQSSNYNDGVLNWCRCCKYAIPECLNSTANNCPSVFQQMGCESKGFCQPNATARNTARLCGKNRYPDQDFCSVTRYPNLSVDCAVSAWSSFSACSRSCTSDGGDVPLGEIPNGVITRTRFIEVDQVRTGLACPPLSESLPCKNTTADTCSQNCLLSEWSTGTCSRTCESGLAARTRTILQPSFGNGTPCGPLRDVVVCENVNVSCPIDCRVGAWSDFGTCAFPNVVGSKNGTCGPGEGVATRSRIITELPQFGGDACPPLAETKPCENPCPVDCVHSQWSAFGNCTFACGPNGQQSRSRTVVSDAADGGMACGALNETRSCNTNITCVEPIDCVVSEWSQGKCSVPGCGGGTRQRTREITKSPTPNGMQCPLLTESVPCNTAVCPSLLPTSDRYVIKTNLSFATFVPYNFEVALADQLNLQRNRINVVMVVSGSTFATIDVQDAVGDPASNYRSAIMALPMSGNPALGVESVSETTRPPTTTITVTTTTTTTEPITTTPVATTTEASTTTSVDNGTPTTTEAATTSATTGDGTLETTSDEATTTTEAAGSTTTSSSAGGSTTVSDGAPRLLANGMTCTANEDCESGTCDDPSGTCVAVVWWGILLIVLAIVAVCILLIVGLLLMRRKKATAASSDRGAEMKPTDTKKTTTATTPTPTETKKPAEDGKKGDVKKHESKGDVKKHESKGDVKKHESKGDVKKHESKGDVKKHESKGDVKKHESKGDVKKHESKGDVKKHESSKAVKKEESTEEEEEEEYEYEYETESASEPKKTDAKGAAKKAAPVEVSTSEDDDDEEEEESDDGSEVGGKTETEETEESEEDDDDDDEDEDETESKSKATEDDSEEAEETEETSEEESESK
jgi:hypothetical protein